MTAGGLRGITVHLCFPLPHCRPSSAPLLQVDDFCLPEQVLDLRAEVIGLKDAGLLTRGLLGKSHLEGCAGWSEGEVGEHMAMSSNGIRSIFSLHVGLIP
jgi:hypothetical protein